MNLKELKEHFTRNKNGWKPKRSFNSPSEIQLLTGFNPHKCTVYKCSICNNYHMTSWKY